MSAFALPGCGSTIDAIEDDAEAKLAPTTPVEDVDCAGYTEEDVPEEGARLTCETFSNDDEIHDPNEQGGRGHADRRTGRLRPLPALQGADRGPGSRLLT